MSVVDHSFGSGVSSLLAELMYAAGMAERPESAPGYPCGMRSSMVPTMWDRIRTGSGTGTACAAS